LKSAGVGVSQLDDSFAAGKEAAVKALRDIGARPLGLSLVFASARYDPRKLLMGIKSALGQVPLVGCTTAGEITPMGPLEGSAAVMVLSSEIVKAGVGVGRGVRRNPEEAGRRAIRSALKDLGYPALGLVISLEEKLPGYAPFFVLMFPDGLSGKEEDLVGGITDVLGGYFPVIGGSAGDDLKLERTYQFCTEGAFTDSITCAIVATNNPVGFSSEHGWRPLEKIALVTKSIERVVKELNYRPAGEVYAEMLGISSDELRKGVLAFEKGLSNPLGMPDLLGRTWLRHPQALMPDGSISFFSRVPEGAALRLMEGDKRGIIKAAENAAIEATRMCGRPKEILATFIFDCVARYKFLGPDGAKRELEAVRKVIGNAPFIGFYTYGEQGFIKGEPIRHRNQTITMGLIGRP
jgi:hypothetical protein